MPGNYTITTRATGTILTAAIYNADHQNHVDNATPQGVGGYSANQLEMQTQTDPGTVGAESLATSVAGELERIRFALARLGGSTYWYEKAVAPILEASKGFLYGYTLVNNSNTKLSVSAGSAMDDTNARMLTTVARVIDCGTVGADGLDAGALANSTWYHIFTIGKADGTDVKCLASTSLTPTMPSSYTLKRRLGSIKTDGSAHILNFKHFGPIFLWDIVKDDNVNLTASGASTNLTMSSPPGVQTDVKFYASYADSVANVIIFSSIDQAAPTPTGNMGNMTAVGATVSVTAEFSIRTNTSSQIRQQADAAGGVYSARAFGWREYL